MKLVNCFEEIRLVFRLEFVLKTVFKTLFKNHVKNGVQNSVRNRVQNHVRRIKKIANKNMSFLKITDPKKRYFIVNEFLKTRHIIQQNFLSEPVGDLSK